MQLGSSLTGGPSMGRQACEPKSTGLSMTLKGQSHPAHHRACCLIANIADWLELYSGKKRQPGVEIPPRNRQCRRYRPP
ncbi:hypothetical protein ACNKHU_13865 [Shigella flexneri]